METKFTPGPWYFRSEDAPSESFAPIRYRIENLPCKYDKYENDWVEPFPETGPRYEAVAVTMCGTADHPSIHNARLIAAAPALYAACKEAEMALRHAVQESSGRVKAELVGGWAYHADRVRAALALADGN